MFAFILNVLVIGVVMWLFFKFMYPKPPKDFFPKEGDDTTERCCDYCQNRLASYRGILQPNDDGTQTLFFCNQEHQQAYHQNSTKN